MQFIDDLSKLHQMGKKKTKDRLRSKSLVRIYIVFGQHYKKYWQALILAYVSLLAFIAVEVLAPWPLKLIVDYLILDQPLPVDVALLQTMRPLTRNCCCCSQPCRLWCWRCWRRFCPM